jgi:hypothetical protein
MAKKPKAKKWLIEEPSQAWKFASVWVGAAIAVITAANEWMPGLQGFMSPQTYAAVMAVFGVLVIVARIVNQNIKSDG